MLGRQPIFSVEAALSKIEKHLRPVAGCETVSLPGALGRILAEDLVAPESLPAHDRSVMDGFAVRASDTFGATESLPAYLEITGEVRMGEFPDRGPGPGQCFRIATGGLLPSGTDAVVMLEHTVPVDERMVEVTRPVASGGNVLKKGEDVDVAQVLASTGHRLRPQDLGLLAGLGIRELAVRPRVRVGILSTGDEIVPCHEDPAPGKVRDINGNFLAAAVASEGAEPRYYGIVSDEEQELFLVLERAAAENELVLLSGGSSVGARDIAARVIERLGPPGILVHGVAMKPGKPLILAFAGDVPVFGLPGHPGAVAVSFDIFVRPSLKRRSGQRPEVLSPGRTVMAHLARSLASEAGRTDIVRIRLRIDEEGLLLAEPVLRKSGALSSLVFSDGYVVIDAPLQGMERGEKVEVRLFAS